jgi:predicted ABC-type ATPase
VNADVIARELNVDPYRAVKIASSIREELVRQRESFVFETVFSDTAGEELAFFRETARIGYTVVLCFIGTSGPAVSEERVAMRVSQGGHDVPKEKLIARYPRILRNLRRAIRELPHVWIFDNDDLAMPFRRIAECRDGGIVKIFSSIPAWLEPLLPSKSK